MKNTASWLTLCLLCLLLSIMVACTTTQSTTGTIDSTEMATDSIGDTTVRDTSSQRAIAAISATKSDTSGSGRAEFRTKADGEVELNLTISFPAMANRSVAVHLHEHGDCGDQGMGAHGHWNPTSENHGKWGSASFHSGDIGNVQLNSEGSGSITLSSNRWTIGGDDKTNILNRAVLVHSGVDDYTSQPAGNAGSRIGCGVISRQ